MSKRPPSRSRGPCLRRVLVAIVPAALVLATALPVITADVPLDKRRSTYEQMSADT